MPKNTLAQPHPGVVSRARRLRRRMSLPEVLLWRELRQGPGALKFRRQHPTGPFVLDFFCGVARLAIEIDGGSHDHPDQHARDCQRDAWLDRAGVETLRACQVLEEAGKTARHALIQKIRARQTGKPVSTFP